MFAPRDHPHENRPLKAGSTERAGDLRRRPSDNAAALPGDRGS
jgi:hypothetical protein